MSVALTVLMGSLQAHDWHEGHEGQKSRAQVCLGRVGEATGGRRVAGPSSGTTKFFITGTIGPEPSHKKLEGNLFLHLVCKAQVE